MMVMVMAMERRSEDRPEVLTRGASFLSPTNLLDFEMTIGNM